MNQKEYEIAWDTCITNAKRFVNAAKKLNGVTTRHIRYHLSVLALEEMGKIEMLNLSYAAYGQLAESKQPRFEDDNHVKKLFMAFQTVTLGRQLLTKELHESHRELAKSIHEKRKQTLYVDISNPIKPETLISNRELNTLMKMAEYGVKAVAARGKLDKSVKQSDQKIKEFDWFFGAVDDNEEKSFVFSGEANLKLVELGDLGQWVSWLYAQHLERVKESEEIIKSEMNRESTKRVNDEEFIPKWTAKIKIYSHSHTIRNRELQRYSKGLDGFKFYQGKDSKWLNIDVRHSDAIKIDRVWNQTELLGNLLFVSLNVGSVGLFTWAEPADRSKYIEKLIDEERPSYRAAVSKQVEGEVEWNNSHILKESDLNNVFRFFSFVSDNRENENLRKSIGSYATGINLFSVSNVHLNLDRDSFKCFYDSVLSAAIGLGDTKSEKSFQADIKVYLDADLSGEFDSVLAKIDSYKTIGITADDVFRMKLLCDLYFNEKAKAWAKTFYESRLGN